MKQTTKRAGAGTKTAKRTTTKAGAKAPVKRTGKPAASVCKKGQSKPAARSKTAVAKKKNPFAGASEVSITQNKIAVTKSSNQSGKGNYKSESTRTYHDKTPANMKALDELMSGQTVKKVTVKFKN